MADKQTMKKITITSPELHGKTRMGVNGVQREVPHNETVEVTEAEYEVLQNADLGTGTKLVDVNDDGDTTGEVTNLNAEGDAKIGTEASPLQAPATPAATSSEPNPLVDGTDQPEPLKGGDVVLDDENDDKEGEKAAEKPAGNKPAGRTKGAGTAKSKAVEGGKDAK